jgi:hypothetical protein
MGWASGSDLADALWASVEKYLPKTKRQLIAQDWVLMFEVRDCDTMLETRVGEVAGIKTDDEQGSHFPWQD